MTLLLYSRFYHPELQRFISEDPIEFEGGDVNLYSYVGNNPVNLVDPTGEVVVALALPLAIPALGALGNAAAYVGTAALAGYLGSQALSRKQEKEKEKEKCKPDPNRPCSCVCAAGRGGWRKGISAIGLQPNPKACRDACRADGYQGYKCNTKDFIYD